MSNILDLNISIKDLDTSYPSPAVGDLRVEVKGFDLKDSQSGGKYIKIQTETLEPTNDAASGAEIAPGFKMFFNLNLPGTPGKEENDEMYKKNIARYVDACFGTDQGTRPEFTGETLNATIGKQILLKIGKAKDTTFGLTQVSDYKALVTE